MRLTGWILGVLFGAFAGGTAYVVGGYALLLAVPALIWSGREASRPAGLAGLFVGAGVGQAGLLVLAVARCTGPTMTNGIFESCSSPDLSPYFGIAALLAAIGTVLTAFVILRRSDPAG